MNYQISERLTSMIDSDKTADPQAVCHILEQELKPILESYVILAKDFKVRFKKQDKQNIFFLEFCAERIKPFGYIPK